MHRVAAPKIPFLICNKAYKRVNHKAQPGVYLVCTN